MITEDDIKRYIILHRSAGWELEDAPLRALVNIANWFAEGAVTELSNHIMEKSDGGKLEYNRSPGCRCGSCNEWQIIDGDDVVVDAADDLWAFIKK